jgi:putative FmdB family regulatory protein
MPIYEYRCERKHTFEVMQRMSDDPLTSCEVCGAPVQRVFHPVAVHFKGSGFYNTDYGKKGKNASAPSSDSSKPDSKSSESKSSESKGSESKGSEGKSSGSSSSSASASSGSSSSSD